LVSQKIPGVALLKLRAKEDFMIQKASRTVSENNGINAERESLLN